MHDRHRVWIAGILLHWRQKFRLHTQSVTARPDRSLDLTCLVTLHSEWTVHIWHNKSFSALSAQTVWMLCSKTRTQSYLTGEWRMWQQACKTATAYGLKCLHQLKAENLLKTVKTPLIILYVSLLVCKKCFYNFLSLTINCTSCHLLSEKLKQTLREATCCCRYVAVRQTNTKKDYSHASSS